jgi:Na+/H+ antiporter NhaD/arsenite permease-like protein
MEAAMHWDFNSLLTLVVFATVILLIACDAVDMVVAGLVGVSVLAAGGVLNARDVSAVFTTANGAIALLFGGMIVARVLVPTGLFDQLGARFLRLTRGSGRRFLVGIVLLVVPLCAILPNATTVILLAPIVVRVAQTLEVDFVGPLVLMSVLSNSAGLLTLVGDPATFLVGSSIGMSFGEYLSRVSVGGLLAVGVAAMMMPWLLRDVWCARREIVAEEPPPLQRPWFCVVALLVLALMVGLFLFGEFLPNPLVPQAVAIIAASLALLVIYGWRIETVESVLRDVDWKTLIFLICMFCMVQAVAKSGVLNLLSLFIYSIFGDALLPVAMCLLAAVSALSAVLANIPVVAGMLVLVKGYLVTAQVVPESALGTLFDAWPAATLPVFMAMMFGGTLGGNATLIGASANIVSAGICAQHGQRVTFMRFLRLGLPVTTVQLVATAGYVLTLAWW